MSLLSIGTWLAENWMILALIVIAVALLVPTYLKQKKEAKAKSELNDSIKKGVKIITTAGVYGVVESVENTTDGKVVTIVTGSGKNPSTMTIHINAIMGIDNKSSVKDEEVVEKTEVLDEDDSLEDEDVQKETKKTTKSSKK